MFSLAERPRIAETRSALIAESAASSISAWGPRSHTRSWGGGGGVEPRGHLVPHFSRSPSDADRRVFFPPCGAPMGRNTSATTGSERRAEQRARELLRTTAGDAAYEMYERFGPAVGREGRVRDLISRTARWCIRPPSGEPLTSTASRFRDGSDPERGRGCRMPTRPRHGCARRADAQS